MSQDAPPPAPRYVTAKRLDRVLDNTIEAVGKALAQRAWRWEWRAGEAERRIAELEARLARLEGRAHG